MSEQFYRWLCKLIASGDIHPFYVTPEWRRLSAGVLRDDRHECQICKSRGRYRKADLVHHVRHVRNHPELALSRVYTDCEGEKKRNLISVCRQCHETVCHPGRMARQQSRPLGFLTEERWD